MKYFVMSSVAVFALNKPVVTISWFRVKTANSGLMERNNDFIIEYKNKGLA